MTLHDPTEPRWNRLLETHGEPSAALRRSILDRTTRVVRRRRHVRRLGLVAALVACYAAGLASARLDGLGPTGAPSPIARSGATGCLPASAAAGEPASANYVRLVGQQEPAIAEPQPARRPPSRFERLCRISDRYLYEAADVTTALRYYRRALEVATDEELAIATEKDSWLLIALKHERIQEKKNAQRET